jgi:hypothetical protein
MAQLHTLHQQERYMAKRRYPPPKRVSDRWFKDISKIQKFSPVERQLARRRLDDIVDQFSADIEAASRCRNKTEQLREIKKIAHRFAKAADALQRLDRATHGAFSRAVAAGLAPLVSVSGLARLDSAVRTRASGRELDSRSWSSGDGEAWSAGIRHEFLRQHGHAAVIQFSTAVAKGVARLADREKHTTRAKGGQPAHEWRRIVLVNLAALYEDMGREPTAAPNGPFAAFAEHVVEAIGWSNVGVVADLPRAIAELKMRRRKAG